MLNDKGRRTIKHLQAPDKWPNVKTGVIRLPATEVRGGWGPGWYDWGVWEIVSFNLLGNRAIVRSLANRNAVSSVTTTQLMQFEEIMPFGTMRRSRDVDFRYTLTQIIRGKAKRKKPRYV